ncbi:hypothetical protein [Campylobacter sp. 19-13652]|nr:hypothetical protein [Campylobacter sp. 19-13652]BCX79275.1 hypothetical protein LBC_07370 [Campylobacter sp. 19-13652]
MSGWDFVVVLSFAWVAFAASLLAFVVIKDKRANGKKVLGGRKWQAMK